MTKRELENAVFKEDLFVWFMTKNSTGRMWGVRRDRKTVAEGRTKRELELFLQGVIVGKEMG